MDWLIENGFWVVVGIAFVAMHLFGHGGHGGHGSHGGHSNDSESQHDSEAAERNDQQQKHRH